MKDEPKFDVIFSEEVDQFLNSIPEKAREKILSNIRKSRFVIDKELFKNSKMRYGNSEQFIIRRSTDFLHFGTRKEEK